MDPTGPLLRETYTMNTALSLPPETALAEREDLDAQMLKVARNLAMDMYELPQILDMLSIPAYEFERWKNHPRFNQYLISEKEAWNSALNTHERTKLKASTVMEEFMLEAHRSMHDKKQPLNHRVELGKLVAKIAGMGETARGAIGEGGPGFSLQINIGQGPDHQVNISSRPAPPVIEHDGWDGYDPFSSPDTLSSEED